jgi:hypothetical protein
MKGGEERMSCKRRRRRSLSFSFCHIRSRRRRLRERVEAEISNVNIAGPISGKDNKIEQEIENEGFATVVNRSRRTSQTNNND